MKLKERIEVTRRGYRMLAEYCPRLIRTKVIAAAAEALSPFVTIWFSGRIINEIAGNRDIGTLVLLVLLTVILGFALSMTRNALNRVISEKESRMWNDFDKIFTDKQMNMDFAGLEDQEIQKQRQKVQENLFMFGNGLGQLIWDTPSLVKVLVGIAASVAITASLFAARTGNAVLDSRLWIAAGAGIMALSGLIGAKLRRREEGVFKRWTDNTVWYNRAFTFYGYSLYAETARAKDVRLYRQDRIADRVMRQLDEHNRKSSGLLNRMSACQGLLELSRGVCNALCYLFVAAKAGLGAFAVGSVVQYVGALMELVKSVSDLFFVITENRVYTGHLQKLFEYLDLPDAKHQGSRPVSGTDHTIEFRNVSFRYPGSETDVLENVSITLHAGRKQALVGANGAGKTTFVKLLCRLYDPTEGQILLDGTDIREYDYDQYLNLFSFVFQDFKLFALPLGQNIAASETCDIERAEDCIRKAALEERYREMPEGLETWLYHDLSEKGMEISGGEAQKIALARALYKGSPVIVLDEPTAALDPIAEAQVYAGFSGMVEDRTAVYISHRLSSCQFCDEITVFDKGRIVQQGTHAELLENPEGKYRELWDAQAQYYIEQ
ncbi:MAG: ABC transporter ATP-binding protein [Clostridia bacterium]|nr:ABC transporter ATP-binding protein [Clostridia bacterium]